MHVTHLRKDEAPIDARNERRRHRSPRARDKSMMRDQHAWHVAAANRENALLGQYTEQRSLLRGGKSGSWNR